jgi:hypothetical protein
MNDQVGLAVHQPLPRPAHRLEVQVQARRRALPEETAEQAEHRRARAQIADHHAQLAFLAHAELGRVRAQALQLAQ